MARYDTVIRDGMVVDGTGMPRRRCDVAIAGGRITRLGKIDPADADRVLDADGLVVAPGFVDLHTHYDAQLFWDPYCTLSGWHGVTSVVIGNCGFGFAPVRPEDRERSMRSMTRVEAIPYDAMREGLPWNWVSYPEFLDRVAATPLSVNLRPFMPVGPLLVWVLGWERAKAGAMPTDAEHAEMRRLLHEAMDAGAGGWSAQRLHPDAGASIQRDFDGTPMVTDVMHSETCFELAGVLAERNDGFIQITNGSPAGEDGHGFIERLAEISGRPVIMNAVQAFDQMPEIHRGQLEWLASCRERGLPVYGQGVTTDAGFTLTFEDWNLFDESDAWCEATTGSLEERLEKLADPARRPALRDAHVYIALGPMEEVVVLGPRTPETKQWANMTVGDVAAATGKHPVDAMLDIAVADRLATTFFSKPAINTRLEGFRELMTDDYLLPGTSDGGAHTKFLTAGRYPTETIIRAVREHGILTLEQAHWKLSALPAHCAGFTDRGTLEVGKAADVVVYDYDRLDMTPVEKVHDFPGGEWRRVQRGVGYRWVLVNGEVTIDDDKETGVPAGRLLRNPVLT
ncbi:MAG TPA: amidohydrolase family protein [Acidimicrobiia bacterium]|nr:amidohydrolase family protein [Acidimicrobiia bacterium]